MKNTTAQLTVRAVKTMASTESSKLQSGEGEESALYKYTSKPSAIRLHQNREELLPTDNEESKNYRNIMFDKRIVRGNTYAQNNIPLNNIHELREIRKRQERKRRKEVKQRVLERLMQKSPSPVKGRMHLETQTEKVMDCMESYVIETDVEVQTEQYLDRPATPKFVHYSKGHNKHTQIYPNDIFDFDIEVTSIIEVLISKIMEQSKIEVFEEEELANLRQRQREFEQVRNLEIVEERRLEEQETRRQGEKKQRLKQKQEAIVQEREAVEKIAASEFSKDLTDQLLPSVMMNLSEKGYFYDPVSRSIEDNFINVLANDVESLIDKKDIVRTLVDSMLHKIVVKRIKSYKKCPLLKESRTTIQIYVSEKNEPDSSRSDSQDDEKTIAEQIIKDETSANDEHNTNISFELPQLETIEEKNDIFSSSKLDANPLHTNDNYPTQDDYPTNEENQIIYEKPDKTE